MNRNFLHWYWKYHSIVCEIVLCCSCLKQASLKISSWENDYDKPNHYSTKWGNLGDNEDSWTCNKQLSWQVVKGWLSPVIESESETFCSRSYDCKWKSKIGVIRDSEVQQNRGQKNKSPSCYNVFIFWFHFWLCHYPVKTRNCQSQKQKWWNRATWRPGIKHNFYSSASSDSDNLVFTRS